MVMQTLNVFRPRRLFVVLFCTLVTTANVAAGSATLSLAEAQKLALERDSISRASQAKERSLQDSAVAANTLPDPKLKLGLMNFPTDTFRRDQEAMTQVQVGVIQQFPRGKSLALKSQRTQRMAEGQGALTQERRLSIRRDVQVNWLEIFYWDEATEVIKKNRDLFHQLVNITRSNYAAGKQNQQDVTRAQLELSLLDDREIAIKTMQDKFRAELAKWVGDTHAYARLTADIPALPTLPSKQEIERELTLHPLLQAEQSRIDVSEDSVELARQQYKPAWMLDVTYGFRDGNNPDGSSRADFLSAMVKVELPLFTNNRQDRKLSASQSDLSAAHDMHLDKSRVLRRMLDDTYAQWTRLTERVDSFNTILVPKARENTQAALNAYQSQKGDFTTLMRASITELETQLKALRLHVDHMQSHARILYLMGNGAAKNNRTVQ